MSPSGVRAGGAGPDRTGPGTCDGVVHVAPGLAVVVLRPFDHHQVGGEVDPPGQGAGRDQNLPKTRSTEVSARPSGAPRPRHLPAPYLDLTVDEQLLHRPPVPLVQTGVVHSDPEGQRQLQVGIPHSGDDVLDLGARSGVNGAAEQQTLKGGGSGGGGATNSSTRGRPRGVLTCLSS